MGSLLPLQSIPLLSRVPITIAGGATAVAARVWEPCAHTRYKLQVPHPMFIQGVGDI